jgi:hypothetical protein
MKVADLLKHYPELESVLSEMSPAFSKLKNPILRKTVARVATLGQAAAIGNISISDLINGLRKAAGFEELYEYDDSNTAEKSKPLWLENSEITESLDTRPMIENGEQPLTIVMQRLNELENGKILELITPFYPAPIIDKARSIGFDVWSDKIENNLARSYFIRHDH